MPLSARVHLGEQGSSEIHAELERILASESFCNSRQSDKLLRYLVKHSLDNRDELLRERVIGVDVFGREPGYDTNEESIVRVRANELRKRLAKYYQDLKSAAVPPLYHTGRILSGRIRTPNGSAHSAGKRGTLRSGNRSFLASRYRQPTARGDLQPSSGSLWIHPGIPGARHRFQSVAHPLAKRRRSNSLRIARCTGATSSPSAISTSGMGSAHAIAAITGLLAERRKPSTTRFGNDISFEDLRTSPAVLVGAFSNHWTLDMTSDWRFVFTEHGASPTIQDRATGQEWALSV